MRIVSLLPGATEIVAALGFAGQLVGRSHECDYPRAVTKVPVVSRPRIDIEAPGAAIDRSIRTLVAVRAGRVYVADGHQYFNRPGPRLADSAEILAEILHPGRFDFGHEGGGWVSA